MTLSDIIKGIAELAVFLSTIALFFFFMVIMTMD
jgi:hypothetical protein